MTTVQTTHNPWSRSPAHLVRLNALAALGLSASAIAPHFTTTRNAIIGACHRHHVQLLGHTNNPHGPTPKHADPRFHNQAPPPPAAYALAQHDPIVRRALQSRQYGAS